MGWTVESQVAVTAENQNEAGLIRVDRNKCPTLYDATVPATGEPTTGTLPYDENDRFVPVGWNVQTVVDENNNTQTWIKSSTGQTFVMDDCYGGAAATSYVVPAVLAVGAVALFWFITKAGK